MYGKKDGTGGGLFGFFACALACGAEKWYDNYLRNVREVILYEIRYRRAIHLILYLTIAP